MTRWILGDFSFDANTRLVRGRPSDHQDSGQNNDVLLEPKSAALLAYFCEHPNRSIGRDELLRTVWNGQIVSDNSINRVVVLLRKALGDDEKARRYIATVPKVGYRMIADVSAIDCSDTRFPTQQSSEKTRALLSKGLIVCAGLALVALLISQTQRPAGIRVQQPPSIAPLSRLGATQSNADLADDGQALLYTASNGAENTVYYRSSEAADPIPVSEAGGDADFARWAHGSEFAVYQYQNANRCEFHRIDRNAMGMRSAQVIYNCVAGSYTELTFSPDNSTLYFVERANSAGPYAVFALDLERGSKRRLSQPVAQGYGNHFVDVHPRSGKLLLLADHAPGKTSAYEIDTSIDSYTLLQRFEYSLDSAIWSHRDGFAVHPSRHPSYQLLETSLETGSSDVIVSDSRRISSPRRISSGDRDYLFTSYLYNRDIEINGRTAAPFNSAVMDYLPTISHDGNLLAFISKRSGDSQIWIRDALDGSVTAIAPPDVGRRFLDLRWSPDDQQLLANTNSGLLIYSMSEEAFVHNISLRLPAHGAHWHDAATLAFSHFEDQQWHAYTHKLTSAQNEPLDERWAFSLSNDQQTLLFDQDFTVYRSGRELSALQACAEPLWRSQLRYRLDGKSIYCHAADSMRDLLRFSADMSVTRLEDVVSRYEFFSVRDSQIARTQVRSAYSDIMRTRRSD
ncbi:winged helix-turn-helix domain-containing protein [Congregibacter brevis]|uniref:Winged helix-turn-helix domain-containing protein n=1 Tax=Congregibacter brevis TaxID=3081201 RepID=A0ABZ0IE00_9GAMM|nr:winged helix-turn-helix domain-containing protein [Congregibacter sp. IMCC45268]